jgi:predicted acetylornithine/succinylornithine family transaminase
MMSTSQEKIQKYLMNTTQWMPMVLVKGEGARVWDESGRRYLDFVGGWAVCCLGHCHPAMVNALIEQARTLTQASPNVCDPQKLKLAELLVENSCLDKVFFQSTGAEANEGAVKLARRYGKLRMNGAYEVITALNSFHGRTLAMTAATGQPHYQDNYQPLPPGFKNVPFNDIDAIKAATTAQTCAVMLEPIQGEGGVNIPDEGHLKAVRKWCDEKGILLILDEIQTGIGRCGTLFAYQQYGIEPDIMTLAKGLGNGVPIGAFLAKDHCSVFIPGDHGSTYGGNPLMCATAYAVVKHVIDHDVPGNAKRIGDYLLQQLKSLKKKYGFVRDVRGKGMLVAVQFDRDIAQDVMLSCLNEGLWTNRVQPATIRMMPPLVIGRAEVDEAVGILDHVLSQFSEKK